MKHTIFAICTAAGLGMAAPALSQADCGAAFESRAGDTLDRVARTCRVPLDRLRALNPGLPGDGELPRGSVVQLADPTGGTDGGDGLTLRGEIREGVECPLLATEGGEVYALTGDMEFTPGRQVEVSGTRAEMSICQQGVATIAVRALDRIDPSDVASSRMQLSGRLGRDGDCTTLTTDGGETFGLLGAIPYPEGTQVELVGRRTAEGTCRAGQVTVEVSRVDKIAPAGD